MPEETEVVEGQDIESQIDEQINWIDKLREDTIGIRFQINKVGIRKAYNDEQKAKAAEPFGANSEATYGGKKLIDSDNPKWKAVTSILNRAKSHWRSITIDYTEKGIRLCNKTRVDAFESAMDALKKELEIAVRELSVDYEKLLLEAEGRLADLFDRSDYPRQIVGMFDFHWDYPALTPPDSLAAISPDLYKREQERVAGRFEEAMKIAEDEFTEQLSKLVEGLYEKMQPDKEGKKKVFSKTTVNSFNTFAARFKDLNIGNNAELTELVEEARAAVNGSEVKQVNNSVKAREEMSDTMGKLRERIGSMMVDRPSRKMKL